MADRPNIAPNIINPLINAVSMATNITGPVSYIFQIPCFSYDIVWTGNPTGTFTVQVSNTYAPAANGAQTNTGNWNSLPASAFQGTYPAPSGSAGNGFLDIVGTGAAWCRLIYTAASGTGTLTVVPAAKVL